MKAKVIEETPYSPNFKKGDVVEIVPGMETDSEGIWNIPGGRLFLCRTEDGHQAYMFPSCLQVLTGEESDSVSEFRKEAATRFAASILANPMWYKRFSGHSVAARFDNAYFKKHVMCNAISYADALIKELRLKSYPDKNITVKKIPIPVEWTDEEKKKLDRIYQILGLAMDEHAFSSTKRLIGDKEGIELQDFLRSIAKPQEHQFIEKVAKMSFGMASNFGVNEMVLDVSFSPEELQKIGLMPGLGSHQIKILVQCESIH